MIFKLKKMLFSVKQSGHFCVRKVKPTLYDVFESQLNKGVEEKGQLH